MLKLFRRRGFLVLSMRSARAFSDVAAPRLLAQIEAYSPLYFEYLGPRSIVAVFRNDRAGVGRAERLTRNVGQLADTEFSCAVINGEGSLHNPPNAPQSDTRPPAGLSSATMRRIMSRVVEVVTTRTQRAF